MKNLLFIPIMTALVFLLSACSTQGSDYQTIYKDEPANFVQENYPLFDVVGSAEDSSNYAEVYVAEGKEIDDVARELEGVKNPDKVSEKNDNKQVLVYKQFFVILTEDEENKSNTLIEFANQEFVKRNYNPSFFQGMLLMSVLNSALNTNDWGRNRSNQCASNPNQCYGGYSSSGGSYKGYENSPTVRGGSVRGGGPGSGK